MVIPAALYIIKVNTVLLEELHRLAVQGELVRGLEEVVPGFLLEHDDSVDLGVPGRYIRRQQTDGPRSDDNDGETG